MEQDCLWNSKEKNVVEQKLSVPGDPHKYKLNKRIDYELVLHSWFKLSEFSSLGTGLYRVPVFRCSPSEGQSPPVIKGGVDQMSSRSISLSQRQSYPIKGEEHPFCGALLNPNKDNFVCRMLETCWRTTRRLLEINYWRTSWKLFKNNSRTIGYLLEIYWRTTLKLLQNYRKTTEETQQKPLVNYLGTTKWAVYLSQTGNQPANCITFWPWALLNSKVVGSYCGR